LIFAEISVFRSYRVRAAADAAARFKPAPLARAFVPAGTEIKAVLWHGLPEFAAPGDTVAAHVPAPVIIDGELLIPQGAWLKGELKELSVLNETAGANISFTQLVIRVRSFSIEARRVDVVIPVESDVEILSTALKTLIGAGLGAAVSFGTGDLRLVDRGIQQGTVSSSFGKDSVPITVVLVRGVAIERVREIYQPLKEIRQHRSSADHGHSRLTDGFRVPPEER
jgi:hypothetical protein